MVRCCGLHRLDRHSNKPSRFIQIIKRIENSGWYSGWFAGTYLDRSWFMVNAIYSAALGLWIYRNRRGMRTHFRTGYDSFKQCYYLDVSEGIFYVRWWYRYSDSMSNMGHHIQ